ncbi:hypothetical protein C8F01DRAFT_1305720 [Mycena amicta]|nr:hypothetical protein C8F01DRAFT_1305720 [Mycena amicta]
MGQCGKISNGKSAIGFHGFTLLSLLPLEKAHVRSYQGGIIGESVAESRFDVGKLVQNQPLARTDRGLVLQHPSTHSAASEEYADILDAMTKYSKVVFVCKKLFGHSIATDLLHTRFGPKDGDGDGNVEMDKDDPLPRRISQNPYQSKKMIFLLFINRQLLCFFGPSVSPFVYLSLQINRPPNQAFLNEESITDDISTVTGTGTGTGTGTTMSTWSPHAKFHRKCVGDIQGYPYPYSPLLTLLESCLVMERAGERARELGPVLSPATNQKINQTIKSFTIRCTASATPLSSLHHLVGLANHNSSGRGPLGCWMLAVTRQHPGAEHQIQWVQQCLVWDVQTLTSSEMPLQAIFWFIVGLWGFSSGFHPCLQHLRWACSSLCVYAEQVGFWGILLLGTMFSGKASHEYHGFQPVAYLRVSEQSKATPPPPPSVTRTGRYPRVHTCGFTGLNVFDGYLRHPWEHGYLYLWVETHRWIGTGTRLSTCVYSNSCEALFGGDTCAALGVINGLWG